MINWEHRIEKIKIECSFRSNKQMEEELGLSNGYINDLLKGKNSNPTKIIMSLVEKIRISPNWIFTGHGPIRFDAEHSIDSPIITSTKIPLLKQTASCGPGQDWGDADMVEDYIEPLALVPSLRGAKVYAFRVRGSSMIGAGIYDGDIVLFDGQENHTPSDDLYVFALDGSVYCKWLKFDPISHRIQIYSVHSTELEKAELIKVIDTNSPDQIAAFHIFGRILAWVRENRMIYR